MKQFDLNNFNLLHTFYVKINVHGLMDSNIYKVKVVRSKV